MKFKTSAELKELIRRARYDKALAGTLDEQEARNDLHYITIKTILPLTEAYEVRTVELQMMASAKHIAEQERDQLKAQLESEKQLYASLASATVSTKDYQEALRRVKMWETLAPNAQKSQAKMRLDATNLKCFWKKKKNSGEGGVCHEAILALRDKEKGQK